MISGARLARFGGFGIVVTALLLTACERGGAPEAMAQPEAPVLSPAAEEERCDDACLLRIQAEVIEHRRKLDSRPGIFPSTKSP